MEISTVLISWILPDSRVSYTNIDCGQVILSVFMLVLFLHFSANNMSLFLFLMVVSLGITEQTWWAGCQTMKFKASWHPATDEKSQRIFIIKNVLSNKNTCYETTSTFYDKLKLNIFKHPKEYILGNTNDFKCHKLLKHSDIKTNEYVQQSFYLGTTSYQLFSTIFWISFITYFTCKIK